MTQQDQQAIAASERRVAREHFWKTIVVPTAKGLEHFFWCLAWFTVIVLLLFGGPCIGHFARQAERQDPQVIALPDTRACPLSDTQPKAGNEDQCDKSGKR